MSPRYWTRLLVLNALAVKLLTPVTVNAAGVTALTLEQLKQQQAASAVKAPAYVDRLIDPDTAEDAPPSAPVNHGKPAPEADGLRTLSIDTDIRHSRNSDGSNQTRQVLDLNASTQTREYGDLSLDAQLSKNQGNDSTSLPGENASYATATLYQNNYLLNDEWTMDNTVGVVRTYQNAMINQSRNLSLPSRTYLGAASRITNGKTEVRVMSGEKGDLSEISGFTNSNQKVNGVSVTHGVNEQWVVGAQGWQADGDDKQHQEATLTAQHTSESGKFQNKAQLLRNESATGVWLDTEYRHDRIQQQAGAYTLGDGLTWMGEDMADNSTGAYWRMDYTHPRFNAHSSVDWQKRGKDVETDADSQELRLTEGINYQYDRNTRIGGQINHNRTLKADKKQQTHVSGFVSRQGSSGQDGRLQLAVRQGKEDATDSSEAGSTRSTELDYTHHWLLPASNDLSWQVNVQNQHGETGNKPVYQTALDWQRQLQDGGSIGVNASLTKTTNVDGDADNRKNYRAFARSRLNKNWNLETNVEQSHDEEGKRNQGVSVSLRYQDSWGKPLGRRDVRSGNIRGVVFFDENNDGRRQPLEKKAVNIELVLDGRISAQTDSNGEFEFRQVASGSHRVEFSLGSIPLPWEVSSNFDPDVTVKLRDTMAVEIPLSKVDE